MLFLDDVPLPGIGDITGAFASPDGSLLAVASSFLTQQPPLGGYGRPVRRVALYRPPERRPIAVFDKARFHVNDVAFHPTRTTLAIATGGYDGGYRYEGALFTFDWTTGRAEAFHRIPTVLRVRFGEDGTIEVLVTPWNDRAPLTWAPLENPDDIVRRVVLPADETWRNLPDDFVARQMANAEALTAAEAARIPEFGVKAGDDPEDIVGRALGIATPRRRGPVLDVALLDGDAVAMVHDGCWLEVFGRDGAPRHAFAGPGHGVRILAAAAPLVHVATFDVEGGRPEIVRGTRLLRLGGGQLQEVFAADERYWFSIDAGGTVLGLPGGYRERFWLPLPPDILIDGATGVLTEHDFRPHLPLGIDGAPRPAFIGREPSDDPARIFFGRGSSRLCMVSPAGTVQRSWQIDETIGGASGQDALAYVNDEVGRGFVISGRLSEWPGDGFILRCDEDGRVLWRQPAFAGANAIRAAPGTGVIVVAFFDGTIILYDAATGATRRRDQFAPGGLPTIATALDIDRTHVAIGTADGRCAVLRLAEFLAGPLV